MDVRRQRGQGRRWATVLVGLAVVGLAGACAAVAGGAGDQPVVDAVSSTGRASIGDPPASTGDTADQTDGAAPAAPTSPDPPTASARPSPEAVVAPDVPGNAEVLDFTARRLAGGTIDGTRLAGRDVALWMWAPWCPQCNREAPHVAEAVRTYGDQVMFVGMAGHDTDEAHRAFVDEHGLGEMLHVVDEDGSLWSQYGVSYQPAWVFIDEDGTTELVAGGLYDDLDARLRALVDE